MPDKDIKNIINRGDWDCPQNAIAALMKRVAAGRDLFDHGEIIGKALTLYQPFASLMAVGEKKIETRSWGTKYRGTIFIHAGSHVPVAGSLEDTNALEILRGSAQFSYIALPQLPRGALLACGTLVDCVQMDEAFCARIEDTREFQLGWYSPGRYAWMIEDMQQLPQIVPIKGQLSLWDVRI